MSEYSAKIVESSKELTAKEKIKYAELTDCKLLDEVVTEENTMVVTPQAYFIVEVHNEKADTTDYQKMVIETTDGERYVTGSDSFMRSFSNIWEAMANEGELWEIVIKKLESKNYKGKCFLTCSIF